ncbi:hypothetical protein M9458_056141 [Cirrhinus mrigala]|uniref:Uncharacterized protein n=1 Tax=Cirrhinus mrigala TaxID=683832 RepID=A0ABD0MFL7_CIRMR
MPNHPSAFHPGQAPWLSKTSLSPEQHCGEKEEISHTEVSPKCTEFDRNAKGSSVSCHLRPTAHEIPSLDKNAEILLLIGRDLLRVHKVQSQVTSMKTYILESGRPSNFPPCESYVSVKEKYTFPFQHLSLGNSQYNLREANKEDIGQSVFCQSVNDNKLAPSVEDIKFLRTMENEFFQDSTNSWVAPLPFRNPWQYLPNNRSFAISRFKSLSRTLEKRPEIKAHFMEFMQKILDSHNAELAPPVQEGKKYWYLSFFGVYHPQKHNQIRTIFDSSARFNSLVGVLLRFRKEPVAITAGIQQMFHCFLVHEDCRDVLCLIWYKDNDSEKEVVDYRMRVQMFGNSPSPTVAIYGLCRVAQEGQDEFGTDVRHFVERDFYMDSALKSFPTVEEAIDILTRTQRMLSASNLKLHKVASNKSEVLDAFPVEDQAKDLQNLNLFVDDLPDQQSL